MFGVPPNVWGPPEHSAIGNIHRDNLILDINTLEHVMNSKQLLVGLMVLSDAF